jgi:hypothetical protein
MGADEAACREQWHGVVFEPEPMAATMKAMLDETGRCCVLLNTEFRTVRATAGRVEFLQLNDGQRIAARSYVDATGDGSVCLGAGCEMTTGREARDRFDEPGAPPEATQQVNGVTLMYRVTQNPQPGMEPLPPHVPAQCWWRGSFPVAQMNHYPNGDLNINMLPTMEGREFIQLGYPAADTECRRRVLAHWHDLQTRYDEFRRYRIAWVAPALGVRETRRIVGEHVLTERDVRGGLSRQTHPDMIAIADHALDTHGSHAHGIGELREPYGVPYRCLIPNGYRNLLIACRAASFSSLAASSCRLSRTMMQLGQAAGFEVAHFCAVASPPTPRRWKQVWEPSEGGSSARALVRYLVSKPASTGTGPDGDDENAQLRRPPAPPPRWPKSWMWTCPTCRRIGCAPRCASNTSSWNILCQSRCTGT